MVSVPKLWPGATVACLATGPSLTQSDVDAVRERARVIAVNDSYRLAPWADALYACDPQWWRWHQGVKTFTGPKWSVVGHGWRRTRTLYPDVQALANRGVNGLEMDPTGLRTGKNSGYQAINLAVHYGAARILLLGYDLKIGATGAHFFGEHPNRRRGPYRTFIPHFQTLVEPLQRLGIEIVNCSPDSALTCFRQAPIREALALEVAA